MLSSISGHHFAGNWPRAVFQYQIDPAPIYLNIPASTSTDLPTKFVNRGSATPLQFSDASGITQVVGPPAYGKNVLGYIGTVFGPNGENVVSTTIPYYLINDTNISVLTPAVNKYRTISYWARIPSTTSAALITLPGLKQIQSLATSTTQGLMMSAYIPSAGATTAQIRLIDRTPTQGTIVDTPNTFALNTWRHFVIVHAYGASNTNSIYVNGTLLYQWQSYSDVPDYTAAGYGFTGEFGSGWGGNAYPDTRWNDLRVEQRFYTQAQAAALFNARRAYYGV